jgi:hypothetical protein
LNPQFTKINQLRYGKLKPLRGFDLSNFGYFSVTILNMGCGGSKGKGDNLVMEPTKIPEFDEVFNSAAEPLETISTVDKSLTKALSEFERHCHVMAIRDHTIKDAVMVMLYCLSASGDGDL